MKSILFISFSIFLSFQVWAGPALLNGPMPTTSTMKTVTIWTQTSEPAEVRIEYWKSDSSGAERHKSPTVKTTANNANVAKVTLTKGLVPGQHYEYEVFVNDDLQETYFREEYKANIKVPRRFQVKPRWRFIPDGDSRHSIFDFRVAAGSCAFINEEGYDREGGDPYGGDYYIFESIYEKRPDLMLWLGDNVYYRENDFESREGMIHRWTHDRAIPELRGLLANAHHFAIWDDHDYGPNDIGSSFPLKGIAKEVFDLFWANPSSGLPETPGIFTFFNWGDANFYLLDNRNYLTSATSNPKPFGKEKHKIGKGQMEWLVNQLVWAQSQMSSDFRSYPARFNIICIGNQVLDSYEYQNLNDEWKYLVDRIVEEGIDGVVFLSGDVHFGEVNKIEYVGGGAPGIPGRAGIKGERYTLHEITTSPLTSGSWEGRRNNQSRYDIFDEPDVDRVGQRNFLVLDFKGPLDNRRMEIRYYDSNGKLLNRKSGGSPDQITDASILYANALKAPREKK